VTPHVSHREKEGDTGIHSSPAVRSPTRSEASREPPRDCEPNGTHAVASELGGPVTAVHGGTVARMIAGRPTPTMERAMEGCSSTGEPGANKMCALEWNEVERRGAVHGAENSGELGRNSSERLSQMESLPQTTEVCTGCARGRESSRQDGAACGVVERPARRLRRWRERWQRSGGHVLK
jgi:hypothetical protein